MLFCPEINSIKLNENGKLYSIKRGKIKDLKSNKLKKVNFQIKEGKKNFNKTFLYLKINEYNEKLTERFGKTRNIRISCAIELNEDNNIIYYPNSTCLFCSLPLIGSESHVLPFIIDSPDFEPDSERQTILLAGNDVNEESGKISDPELIKWFLEDHKNHIKL